MKSRILYFLIAGIIILSFFTGIFIWRTNQVMEIPKFKTSFNAPISSKYVPINADLTFHWKINPNILPNYVENYQDKVNKNIINEKATLIRDTYFNLISINFTKEISKLAGDYGSFAIFDTKNQLLNDWLIVLETKKDINIDEEIERFSSQRVVEENIKSNNDLDLSSLSIFSKKVNSNQTIYFLNEKKHILISSNPEIIKLSISQSEEKKVNTKEKYENRKLRDKINDGVLLLEMSPKKIFNTIGQEKDLLEINQTDKLISSINIEKKKLVLEGILSYDIKNKRPINDKSYDLIDIGKEFNLFNNFILIDNPEKYFGKNSIHPYKKLIASIIQESAAEDYSNLFKIILKHTKGNLIWLKDRDWLALTNKANTDTKKINDVLKKEKFSSSNLEFKNKNLKVWSKITTNNNEKYEIKESIEAIVEENEGNYIWSQNLSSFSDFDGKEYLANNLDSEYKNNEMNDFDDILRIHLDKEKTKVFLNNFYPYILLRTMLGNKLNFPHEIDISIAVPTINYPDFIKFKINLKTS